MLQHDHELADDGAGQFQAQLGGRQMADMRAKRERRQLLAQAEPVQFLADEFGATEPMNDILKVALPQSP